MSDFRRRMISSLGNDEGDIIKTDWYKQIKGIASDGNSYCLVNDNVYNGTYSHGGIVIDFSITISNTQSYVRKLFGVIDRAVYTIRSFYVMSSVQDTPSSNSNIPDNAWFHAGSNPASRMTDAYNAQKNLSNLNRKMTIHYKVKDTSKSGYMYYDDTPETKYYFSADDSNRTTDFDTDFPIMKCYSDSKTAEGDSKGVYFHHFILRNNGSNITFHLIPVVLTKNITADKSSDLQAHNKGELGMIDLVTQKFLPNVGTGSFIGMKF